MIRALAHPSPARRAALCGALLVAAAQGATVRQALAQEGAALQGGAIRIADRCSFYGAGFTDVGNGTCARIVRRYGEAGTEHVHVDLGHGAELGRGATADAHAWSTGGTANAALRSDGYGMLPGAADAQHLRVPGALFSR